VQQWMPQEITGYHFLMRGEYEIHFCFHTKKMALMVFEVSSLIQGISPTSVTVDAQSEATLNVIVIGKNI
jgi:hypothetical protein